MQPYPSNTKNKLKRTTSFDAFKKRAQSIIHYLDNNLKANCKKDDHVIETFHKNNLGRNGSNRSGQRQVPRGHTPQNMPLHRPQNMSRTVSLDSRGGHYPGSGQGLRTGTGALLSPTSLLSQTALSVYNSTPITGRHIHNKSEKLKIGSKVQIKAEQSFKQSKLNLSRTAGITEKTANLTRSEITPMQRTISVPAYSCTGPFSFGKRDKIEKIDIGEISEPKLQRTISSFNRFKFMDVEEDPFNYDHRNGKGHNGKDKGKGNVNDNTDMVYDTPNIHKGAPLNKLRQSVRSSLSYDFEPPDFTTPESRRKNFSASNSFIAFGGFWKFHYGKKGQFIFISMKIDN